MQLGIMLIQGSSSLYVLLQVICPHQSLVLGQYFLEPNLVSLLLSRSYVQLESCWSLPTNSLNKFHLIEFGQLKIEDGQGLPNLRLLLCFIQILMGKLIILNNRTYVGRKICNERTSFKYFQSFSLSTMLFFSQCSPLG